MIISVKRKITDNDISLKGARRAWRGRDAGGEGGGKLNRGIYQEGKKFPTTRWSSGGGESLPPLRGDRRYQKRDLTLKKAGDAEWERAARSIEDDKSTGKFFYRTPL